MAITMRPREVQVTCKKCGQKANASDFKIEPVLGIMVCPKCYTGKAPNLPPVQQRKEEYKPKPTGWDKDDEIVDTLYKEKQKIKMNLMSNPNIKIERIPGSDFINYACDKCKYKFKYNLRKRYPTSCPACNRDIPKEINWID